MSDKPSFCQSYDDAREAFIDGELQYWDGTIWTDIPRGSTPFFSRRIEEYRRRPKLDDRNFTMIIRGESGQFIRGFGTAKQVADYLWESKVTDCDVFKRVRLDSLDTAKIQKQLEEA